MNSSWAVHGEIRIRDLIVHLVQQGVEDGFIVLDEDTGRANAIDPEFLPKQKSESLVAYSKRLGDRNQLVRTDRVALKRAVERTRRVDDLNYVLRDGTAQAAALRGLGVEVDDVSTLDAMLANGVSRDLAVIAEGGVVTGAILERQKPLIQWLSRNLTKTAVPTWAIALENLFEVGAHLEPMGDPSPSRVRNILGILSDMCSEIPRQMSSPSDEQIADAARFLQTMRVNTLKLSAQPKPVRRGRSLTPWVAMHRFASCFGVGAMVPERKKDRLIRK